MQIKKKINCIIKNDIVVQTVISIKGKLCIFLNLLDVHGINIRHTVNMVNFVTYVIRYVLLSSSLNGFAVNMFQGNNANM